jgi:hypothetical protein
MFKLPANARPERGSKQPAQANTSRHRAEPAKPASALARFAAGIPAVGYRAAIVTAACAALIGGGAAGQASELASPAASSAALTSPDTGLTPAETPAAETPSAAPAPTESATEKAAEQPAASPAPAAEPAPAAPAPAVEPAPAAPAPAPEPAPAPAPEPAPAVAVDDPAGAQAYAASQLGAHGWAPDQMQCLQTLWTKESEWKTTATNASSGAYGIVQSLPAEKMASAGADYLTNYRTQINWGLGYIKERYGSPCGALNFHYANNWY